MISIFSTIAPVFLVMFEDFCAVIGFYFWALTILGEGTSVNFVMLGIYKFFNTFYQLSGYSFGFNLKNEFTLLDKNDSRLVSSSSSVSLIIAEITKHTGLSV